MKALFVGGKFNGMTVEVNDIINNGFVKDENAPSWNGKFRPNYSEERAKGYCVPRSELDNQPLVDGYLSPMWDGDKLRYETQEVYDMMCD